MNQEIINRIRAFNRYYVRIIGLLENSILNSGYSLVEAHILSTVYAQPNTTATHLNKELNLDEGYLSRVIKKMLRETLITKEQSTLDKRVYTINLTPKGKAQYQKLDRLSTELVASYIAHLNQDEKIELADLMDRAKFLLTKKEE